MYIFSLREERRAAVEIILLSADKQLSALLLISSA